MTPDPIPCSAGCKRSVADMAEALAKAWTFLQITNRWRCPACTRELEEANKPKIGSTS